MIKSIEIGNIEEYKLPIDNKTLERIKYRKIDRLERTDEAIIVSFDIYDINDLGVDPGEVIIYFSQDELLFFCENKNVHEIINMNVRIFESTEKTFIYFLEELFLKDLDFLEEMENQIETLEYGMLTIEKIKCLDEILSYRKKLSSLKKYYGHLVLVTEEIVLNENRLITNDGIKHFQLINNKLDRLELNVLNLKEYLSQVRETYQAQIDIEQNRLMKFFTIITSIFLPLTLIVGWYGMNFDMPEYSWKYGYSIVAVLSFVVILVSLIYFKKKEWFK